MARVMIIPGLTVRRYLQPSALALRQAGHQVVLSAPLGWPGTGTDLRHYGANQAATSRRWGSVDLLIGCSVGTQAATAAALAGADAAHLLLISPTIEPGRRSVVSAFRGWLGGENHRDSPRVSVHAHDWVSGGPTGIVRGLQSAIAFQLEQELPRVESPITIVHGDSDELSPLPFAGDLADRSDASLLIMPDSPHSWPVGDPARFAHLVAQLTGHEPDGPARADQVR